jgi:hypothetical protein
MRFLKNKKNEKNFISKSMIGLGYGLVKTNELILNKDLGITPQDAMDALSIWIGRELMKEMLDQKIVKVTDDDEKLINSLLNIVNLAEELDVNVKDETIGIIVQKCLICPKRVGGYDLGPYTACPVGGFITGALSYARGIEPTIIKNNLQTGQICHINVSTHR